MVRGVQGSGWRVLVAASLVGGELFVVNSAGSTDASAYSALALPRQRRIMSVTSLQIVCALLFSLAMSDTGLWMHTHNSANGGEEMGQR